MLLSNKRASTEIIKELRQEDMCEAYRKLFKTDEHGGRDISYYRRACFKDICSSRVRCQKFPDTRSTGVDNLFNNEPATQAIKEFLKFSTSHSNDVFCISVARLDTTTTNVIDALKSSFDQKWPY